MRRTLWISVIAVGALADVAAIGQSTAPTLSMSQGAEFGEMRRVTVDLSKLSFMQTAVGFGTKNKPPSPRGNCLTLSTKTNATSGLPPGEWHLANIHAENFHQLVKRLRLKRLEMGLLAGHRCLVVDSRVPQEWLLISPCTKCYPLERRQAMKSRFAGFFRKDPEAEALIGTTWVLVSRKDQEGLIERLLPGERIKFGAFELTCHNASGRVCGRRSWESDGTIARYLAVYDVKSTNSYNGAYMRLERRKDQMTLVPGSILRRDAETFYNETYTVPAEATYRIEESARK